MPVLIASVVALTIVIYVIAIVAFCRKHVRYRIFFGVLLALEFVGLFSLVLPKVLRWRFEGSVITMDNVRLAYLEGAAVTAVIVLLIGLPLYYWSYRALAKLAGSSKSTR